MSNAIHFIETENAIYSTKAAPKRLMTKSRYSRDLKKIIYYECELTLLEGNVYSIKRNVERELKDRSIVEVVIEKMIPSNLIHKIEFEEKIKRGEQY